MSEEQVRVITNFEGFEFETVPLSRVPHGHVRIHIRDRGEFYADPAGLVSEDTFRHTPFSQAARGELQKQYELFTHARIRHSTSQTFDDWVDGFRKDRTPWKEMALWDLIATAFRKFTGHLPDHDALSVSKRNDVYNVILSAVNDAPHMRPGMKFESFNSLTSRRVGEIIGWMHSDEAKAIRREALKKHRALLREQIREAYPDRATFYALFTEDMRPNPDAPFDVIEFLATADIIMAEDVTDPSERCVVYGEERHAQLVASAVDDKVNIAGVRLVFIDLDLDTDELEKLSGFVAAVNGRDE